MSIHVVARILDGAYGRPAAGVPVCLEIVGADGRTTATAGLTTENGCWEAAGDGVPCVAQSRLVLDTGAYFAAVGVQASCVEVAIGLRPQDTAQGCRVTVMVVPAGCTVHVQG